LEWKPTLYEYVQHRNQMEVDYTLSPVISYVKDEHYLEQQDQRLNRLYRQHKERNLQPLQSETRLRLLGWEHNEGQVRAVIRLAKKFEYEIKGRKHNEERVEQEQVTLVLMEGKWCFLQVDPDVSERKLSGIPLQINRQSEFGDIPNLFRLPQSAAVQVHPTASIPYLNRDIFPHDKAAYPLSTGYDRKKAREYADRWWNVNNPQYLAFEDDCTHYVSQCLFAGGASMNYTGLRDSGWWYRGKKGNQEQWSFSWAVTDSLRRYLSDNMRGLRATSVDSPDKLAVGDVIAYSWFGNNHYNHSTLVTELDYSGMPLVNSHTVNSKRRYWDYRDSYAWTDQTEYRFYHIADE
jgi:hypothetical protein